MHYAFTDVRLAEEFDSILAAVPVLVGPGSERTEKMLKMFMAGESFENIGQHFGVTRERVRQIVKKVSGLTARDGPRMKAIAEAMRRKAEAKLFMREEACRLRFGCSLEEWSRIPRRVTSVYFPGFKKNVQRLSGAECGLTLWEWWCMLEEAGVLELMLQRGRKYQIRRRDKTVPYSRANCYVKMPGIVGPGLKC